MRTTLRRPPFLPDKTRTGEAFPYACTHVRIKTRLFYKNVFSEETIMKTQYAVKRFTENRTPVTVSITVTPETIRMWGGDRHG